MNPQTDPLAALHPLREPPPIGWWPPAPGWWLLAALACIALLVLVWLLVRRYRARAYRRQALAQLAQLRADYQREQDSQGYLAGANALLKSVALLAFPRRDVAAGSGADWLALLNSGLRKGQQFPENFVSGAYRRERPDIDVDQLHDLAASWIKRHEVRR
jgi:hypothetical protein